MTTATTNTVIDHTSDTGYRNWIIDFHNLISTAGLVQTADTGQVNTATVTRPATGTSNGFSTWRLPDSSLYFRFDFGTDFTNIPRILFQVGEGTNGTGTLTGQLSSSFFASVDVSTGSSVASTVTNYTSYCCVTNDFFGIHWKAGALAGPGAGRALGVWYVMKTVNSSGTATSLGYMVVINSYSQSGGSDRCTYQMVRRTATAITYTATTEAVLIPGATASLPSTSIDPNGDTMVYPLWGAYPTVQPMMHVCCVRVADLTTLSTFSAAVVGASSHTYIVSGNQGALNCDALQLNSGFKLAMLWE